MTRNKFCKRFEIGIVIAIFLLSGCREATSVKGNPVADPDGITSSAAKDGKGCVDQADKDYVPLLKLNGVTYMQNYNSDINNLKKGKKVGEIRYRMSGNACTGYIMQDGDATVLREGTVLYEVLGYTTSARLWAGDFLYEATVNPKAKTINDLLDIAGKIKTVRFISGKDGITHLKDFTPKSAASFAEAYPKLKYVPFNKLFKETQSWSGGMYWIQVELNDGSSIQITYNLKYAAFNPAGYATPELASLVEEERKRIYAK